MKMPIIHWSGAIFGLVVAIVLIFRKINPVYAIFGGASLAQTVSVVIDATNSVMP
jgi:gluconate:H+ symporter, GntP family